MQARMMNRTKSASRMIGYGIGLAVFIAVAFGNFWCAKNGALKWRAKIQCHPGAHGLQADIRSEVQENLHLSGIACCNGAGDVLLKRGMDNLGEIHLNHWTHIFNAFIDPWMSSAFFFLAGFFYAYLTALSWADLTYVLPATAFGYVVTAFLSRFFLHEAVSRGDGGCASNYLRRRSGGARPSLTERRTTEHRTKNACADKEQHELA